MDYYRAQDLPNLSSMQLKSKRKYISWASHSNKIQMLQSAIKNENAIYFAFSDSIHCWVTNYAMSRFVVLVFKDK